MGLDLGTSSLKVLLLNEKAEICFVHSEAYPSHMPRPGWIEQDPADYERAMEKVIAAALERVPPKDIAAVGFSGHMSATVLVDPSGRPVMNCITLSDNRGGAESLEIAEKAGERIFKNTGNPVITAFSAPKLLWLQRNRNGAFTRAAHYIAPKDYLRFLLCGRISAEYTDAANSLLLDSQGQWDWDLIKDLGLPVNIFPEILKPSGLAGTVTKAAARRFGLGEGTPVIAGGADMACGAVGTGINRPGDAAVTIGTSATFLCAVRETGKTGRGSVTYHPHPLPGCFYALGSHFNGGLALNWFSSLFSSDGEINYSILDDLAERLGDIPPGSRGLLCLPFLAGSGTPYFSTGDSGAFIGLNQIADRTVLFRSLLEGIALNLRQSLELFEEINGGKLKSIRIAGGGSKIRGWARIITDVFGRDTLVAACPHASAVGAAVLGGAGTGMYPDTEEPAAKCFEDQIRLSADAGNHRVYHALYGFWREAHDVLEHVSGGLKNMFSPPDNAAVSQEP
jgi:xylulokinase